MQTLAAPSTNPNLNPNPTSSPNPHIDPDANPDHDPDPDLDPDPYPDPNRKKYKNKNSIGKTRKKIGSAGRYITRTQAVGKLQVTLALALT